MNREEKFKKLQTLPWYALHDIAVKKGIEEKEVNGKDKTVVVSTILSYGVLSDEEIEEYVNDYIYLGIVEDIDEGGAACITQRNKFCVGDSIEIMKPDGRNEAVTVLGMTTEDGESVESAPHPQQKLHVKLSQTPDRYDLLRVENRH